MKIIREFLCCLCLVLFYADSLHAKDWRQIVPLHSTREDVIRILGQSDDENQIRAKYSLENEDVYIVFASDQRFFVGCVKELPLNTVLLIRVTPKTELHLIDLPIDEKKLKRFDPSDPPNIGYVAYLDEIDGIVITTLKGRVNEISYIAAAKDRHLCPAYYENPQKFAQMIIDSKDK